MRKISERIRELVVSASQFLLKISYVRKPFKKFRLSDLEIKEIVDAHELNKSAILQSLSDQGLGLGSKKVRSERGWEVRIDSLATDLCLTEKKSSVDWSHGYVLTAVIHKYLTRQSAGVALDFGTARGFSAIIMAEGLKEVESTIPVLTMDILPHEEKMYWNSPVDRLGRRARSEIWSSLNAANGIVFLEGPISRSLKILGVNRVRLAFLDSQHTREQVETELRFVTSRQEKGDLIVFDDFGSSGFNGVVAGAKSVLSNQNYFLEAQLDSLHKTVAIWRKS